MIYIAIGIVLFIVLVAIIQVAYDRGWSDGYKRGIKERGE